MEYHLNRDNYCTFETFEVNRLPGRSYFIPYPSRAEADAVSAKEKRYRSEKVRCLNGEWDFAFCPEPDLIPEFVNTDEIDFDRLEVPSCWQFKGYDRPFADDPRKLFKIGVSFSTKDRRIEDWKVVG